MGKESRPESGWIGKAGLEKVARRGFLLCQKRQIQAFDRRLCAKAFCQFGGFTLTGLCECARIKKLRVRFRSVLIHGRTELVKASAFWEMVVFCFRFLFLEVTCSLRFIVDFDSGAYPLSRFIRASPFCHMTGRFTWSHAKYSKRFLKKNATLPPSTDYS